MSRCLLCVTKGYRKRIPGRKGKKELIHQYKNNGFNIVLDVNSGAVHVVDDVVYDVIASTKLETVSNFYSFFPLSY